MLTETGNSVIVDEKPQVK